MDTSPTPLSHLMIELSNKGKGLGEDASPLFLVSENKQMYVVGAFDGMGGSGSTIYTNKKNSEKHTGAYLASRAVRDVVECFFQGRVAQNHSQITPSDIDLLKQKIVESLEVTLDLHSYEPSRIKSSMVRVLPTTMAVGQVIFQANQDAGVFEVLWAGDSRVYFLSSKLGCIQLTKDDLKLNNDPYQNIKNDSPLSNKVCLDSDFTINHKTHTIPNIHSLLPGLFFAATDGCFQFFKTPMHFEELFLRTLQSSDSMMVWQKLIADDLQQRAGDDCTMPLVCLTKGTFDFSAFKAAFSKRQSYLHSNIIVPITELEDTVASCNEAARQADKTLESLYEATWNVYKNNYYFFFNPPEQ